MKTTIQQKQLAVGETNWRLLKQYALDNDISVKSVVDVLVEKFFNDQPVNTNR